MPNIKFLNATPDDKGAPGKRHGWIQEVNSHSAIMRHALRRKSLVTTASSNSKTSSENNSRHHVRATEAEGDVDEHISVPAAVAVSTASVQGKSQAARGAATLSAYSLNEITSSLDPFFKLPVECSDSEKSLLSFHLQHGRRAILGTRAKPKYDMALDAGRQQIESNPVWAWVHIVMAEEILSQLTHRPKSPNFFRRRASAYADTKKLLLDDHVSIPAKLATLLMLQVMESCTGNWNLQAIHSDAIDQVITANGGLTLFFNKNKGENDMVQPIWFLSIWRAGLFKLLPRDEFEEASSHLCSFFYETRQWMVSARSSDTDQGRRQCNMIALVQLIRYLSDLISTHLCLEDETSALNLQGLASFALILHLCGTFTRLDCDLGMSTKLLLYFQEYIKDSFSDADDVFPEASKLGVMHLNGVTSMLSHVRREVCIPGVPSFSMEQEIQLCIVSMHAVKIFPMLCKVTRLHIARRLLSCALLCTQDSFEESFSDEEIEDVRAELDLSWYQAMEYEYFHACQQSLDMSVTSPDTSQGSP